MKSTERCNEKRGLVTLWRCGVVARIGGKASRARVPLFQISLCVTPSTCFIETLLRPRESEATSKEHAGGYSKGKRMAVPGVGIAFSLKNIASGLYLGIKDRAGYAGAEAVLLAPSSGSPPRWFLQAEQGAHYLINASFPGLCLNVAYESTSIGAGLQQWNCNGGLSELWTLVPTSSGNCLLVNKNSDRIAGAVGVDNASPITQMAASNEAAHMWRIVNHDSRPHQPISSDAGEFVDAASLAANVAVSIFADEMIYNIYTPIYSPTKDLNAITQDLPRIAGLGFSTILLMPIHPIGVPTGEHPAVGSPYAVADFYSIDPGLGQLFDFANLVNQAHTLGLKVIMDVVLNHTAWTHPFITQRPELYVHTDKKKTNPNSITQAFWFHDVAQLDYKSSNAVRDYMSAMLVWWMKEFGVDGFRFDTVDNPYGNDRMIPASSWSFIGKNLKAVNPRVILLGECTNPDLSLKPFNIDYTNYSLQPAVVSGIRSQDASKLSTVFNELKRTHPVGMLHTSIMQTWDMDLDLNMYGGPDETLVAAVFNFAIEGVPMLFAGEEVGNDHGGVNTHTPVNWNGLLAHRFLPLYKNLGMLRRRTPALRRGSTTWPKVDSASLGVVAFVRTSERQQCLIVINFSESASQGKIRGVANRPWTEVTPPGAAYPAVHPEPPFIELGPWDFAIFLWGLHDST